MKKFLIFASLAFASSSMAEDGKTFEVAGLKFTAAASWKEQAPTSAMRKAQFKVGDGEMVVFFFGKGQGGGVEANVARWLGQFEEPKEQLNPKSETEEVAGGKAKVTTVSANGTFLSGPPFGKKIPKADYALRGAIVECEGGPVFLKLTGPKKKVEGEAKAFDKMVRSAFAK